MTTPWCSRLPWCRNRGTHRTHGRDLGTLGTISLAISVMLMQPDDDGTLGPAFIRLRLDQPSAEWATWVDVPITAAATLGAVLAALPYRDLPELANALSRGAQMVEGGTRQ